MGNIWQQFTSILLLDKSAREDIYSKVIIWHDLQGNAGRQWPAWDRFSLLPNIECDFLGKAIVFKHSMALYNKNAFSVGTMDKPHVVYMGILYPYHLIAHLFQRYTSIGYACSKLIQVLASNVNVKNSWERRKQCSVYFNIGRR